MAHQDSPRVSLVQRLIDDSAGDNVTLSSLLRQARVLAHKLGNQELNEWAVRELEGYHNDGTVPDYRKALARNVGQFRGPFGAEIKNAPLPMALFPENVRDIYEMFEARAGIRVYEDYFEDGNQSLMAFQWNQDIIAFLQHTNSIYENYVLVVARQEIAKPFFVGILDTVRNRLLSLALALQEENPDVVDSDEALLSIPGASAASIVQITIHGGQQNIATGDRASQTAITVIPHDRDSLLGRLKQLEVPEDELAKLTDAIEKDAASAEGFGPSVRAWIGAATAGAVGNAAGQAMLSNIPMIVEAIHKFFG